MSLVAYVPVHLGAHLLEHALVGIALDVQRGLELRKHIQRGEDLLTLMSRRVEVGLSTADTCTCGEIVRCK